MRLYERLLPYDYLYPLETTGPGFELLQAFAKIGERTSLAAYRLDQDLYSITANAESFASVEVELFRSLTSASAAFTQQVGTLVETTEGGRKFRLLQDAVFSTVDVGPITVPAQALFASYQWNVLGQEITPDAEVLAGEISKVVFPVQNPPFAEPFIRVRQIQTASGGSSAMLEQIGLDRGITRSTGESIDAYRYRIGALPDTVSPAAMKRNLDLIWLPIFETYAFIETWDVSYQSCYLDDMPAPIAPISGSDFDPTTFVYDDPRPTTPFRNRWLDEIEFRGTFIVILPKLTSIFQRSIATDDVADDSADFLTALGQRACPAFDLDGDLSDVSILTGFFDGYDVQANAYYKSTFDTLQQIKPAGVAAILELEGN